MSTGTVPLVCLHGWGMNLRVFDGLVAALAPQTPVLAWDLPGHGRAAWDPAQHAGFEDVALEFAGRLPQRCALLGWSLGGQFALRLATLAPERIEHLVLVSTTPRFESTVDWPFGLAPQMLQRFAALLAADPRQCVSDFLDLQLRGSAGADTTRAALEPALREQGDADPRALAAGLAWLRHNDLRTLAPSLRLPVLVIGGQHDRITPDGAGAWLAQQIPGARHHCVRRAGHLPFISHAAEVLALLRTFLAHCAAAA